MTPYKVIIRCLPIALKHPWIALDGLLAHLAAERTLGERYKLLPLKRVVPVEELWGQYAPAVEYWRDIPRASVSIFEPDRKFSMQHYKRTDLDGFPAKSIRQGVGRYRNWIMTTVYVAPAQVTFYGCGDVELVRDLLSGLTHLGTDSSQGWGLVNKVDVVSCEEDWSLVHEGRAMRPIPVEYLSTYEDVALMAWRPPYWAAETMAWCAPPGTEVTLNGQ